MENKKKMYDGLSYEQKMKAMDMIENAVNQIDETRKALDHFISLLGMEDKLGCEKQECCDCGKQDAHDIGLEELSEFVSERTGFCPRAVAVILDTAMTILGEMSEEDFDDADKDN